MRQLVIQLARMGDLLQTKRLVLSLAREGRVHLLVDSSLTAFAAQIYPFAEIHGITAHAGRTGEFSVFEEVLSQLEKLKAQNFDRVYNLNFSGLNLALSTLWPPEAMRGHWFDKGQALRSSWLNLAFRWSSERRTAPLNLMDLWGLLADRPVPPSEVNPKASPKGGGLGVMLAGRMARRSVPPAFLARCISAVWQRMGQPDVFLFGTSAEFAAGKEIMRELPAGVLNKTENLAGATGLIELSEKISKLDRLLTPDTGGMHLAAQHGVPVEAFFLSSAWAYETGPYGEGHRVWQAVQPCLPCLESQPCPYDVKCLAPIKENSFLKVLSKPGEAVSYPPGLIGLETCFDSLGACCRPIIENEPNYLACEEENRRRMNLRRVLAEYSFLKLGDGYSAGPASALETAGLYEQIFRESDWMLPRQE